MRSITLAARTTLHALVAATLIVGLAACTDPLAGTVLPEGQPGGVAKVVADYDCLAPNPTSVVYHTSTGASWGKTDSTDASDAPPAGSPPADFRPVAAYQCADGVATEDVDGVWSAVAVTKHKGDLTALMAALNQPDGEGYGDVPPGVDEGLAGCSADLQYSPLLWLVDAAGAAVHVRWPTDGCGKNLPEASAALTALGVDDYSALRKDLLTPRAALDLGCPASIEGPVPSGVPQPTSIDAPALAEATTLTWCRYTPNTVAMEDAYDPDVAYSSFEYYSTIFIGGGTLTGDDAARVRGALVPPAAVGACQDRPSDAVRLTDATPGVSPASTVVVWLDGCASTSGGDATTPTTALPGDLTPLFE